MTTCQLNFRATAASTVRTAIHATPRGGGDTQKLSQPIQEWWQNYTSIFFGDPLQHRNQGIIPVDGRSRSAVTRSRPIALVARRQQHRPASVAIQSFWLQVQPFWQGMEYGAVLVIKNLNYITFITLYPAWLCGFVVYLMSEESPLDKLFRGTLIGLSYISTTVQYVGATLLLLVVVVAGTSLSPAYCVLTLALLISYALVHRLRLELLTTCMVGPIVEEVIFRFLPATMYPYWLSLFAHCRSFFQRNKVLSGHHENTKQSSKWYYAFASVLSGVVHVSRHIATDSKLADIDSWVLMLATADALSAFLLAYFLLLPLYQRRGLSAVIGAHVAWSTLVALLSFKQLSALALLVSSGLLDPMFKRYDYPPRWNDDFKRAMAQPNRRKSREAIERLSNSLDAFREANHLAGYR
jgi:hypothetical protein